MEDTALAGMQAGELAIPEIEQPFVGQWQQLVSTTNWEKGRIIHDWREALLAAQAPASEYSDDAWSRRVGGVTGQHVGRLRRVFQRFGQAASKYDGLYWSHFQAALDWDDAEMWLEGAAQSEWSVAQMRRTRWETLGAVAADEPRESDLVTTESDEDYIPPARVSDAHADFADRGEGPIVPEGPDFGEESQSPADERGADDFTDEESFSEAAPAITPFQNLAELPADVADAFDAMKLAILRHKNEGWVQVARDDLISALDALKELALAPSSDYSSA